MLDAFPKGRKAAFITAIVVAVYYSMVLLQALNWRDEERFLTQLIVAPFAVAFWSLIAFVVGAIIDILVRLAKSSGSTSTAPHPNKSSDILELADGISSEGMPITYDEKGDSAFVFTESELAVYGFHMLDLLDDVLRTGSADEIFAFRNTIGRKIGRVFGVDDERPFLEAYSRQLRARLNDPTLAVGNPAVNLTRDINQRKTGWPKWVWWAAGIFLFLAYCNYSGRDQRPEPPNATSDMSYSQASEYRRCMELSRGYNLSDYVKSDTCRKSALGYSSGLECRTEWDGRANSTICEPVYPLDPPLTSVRS